MAEAKTETVSRVILRTVGDPEILKADENKGKDTMPLGRLLGIIHGPVTRANASGEGTWQGLKGDFLALSADGTSKRGPILVLPDPMQAPLLALYAGKEKPKGPIKMAFNIAVARANNDAGFTWRVEPLVQPGEMETPDLMAQLSAEVEKAGTKKGK